MRTLPLLRDRMLLSIRWVVLAAAAGFSTLASAVRRVRPRRQPRAACCALIGTINPAYLHLRLRVPGFRLSAIS